MDDALGDNRGGSGDQDAFQDRANSFDDPPPKDEHAIHRLQSINCGQEGRRDTELDWEDGSADVERTQ
ncbi:unnamed protein product [Heligmosomoides polygyrus]|uniref:Uncharacterized protein n=1 Tax=Heligmosomoides polygyrus TaxID=6339 RepID=A0A183GN05_HELPZ|nr:unnamed protein product [Heligmosomoides polygyrus]